MPEAAADGPSAPAVGEPQRLPKQLNQTIKRCASRDVDSARLLLADPAHERHRTSITVALDRRQVCRRAQNLATLEDPKANTCSALRTNQNVPPTRLSSRVA